MKKILFISLFAACAAMSLSSCMNGDYSAKPIDGSNPLNPGSGGGGGGGGSFSWSGTDPMSAKVDGTAWQASGGFYMPGFVTFPASVTGQGPNSSTILVNIPDNAAANSTTNFNSSVTASYSASTTSGNPNDVYAASLGSGGSVLIIENDATHVKGKFSFNAKNTAGTSVSITEGYFNIKK